MNNPALLTQATHTLGLLSRLDKDGLKKLHDGYLSDLALAIEKGTVTSREKVCRALGLYQAVPQSDSMTLTLDYATNSWGKWRGSVAWELRHRPTATAGVGVEVWEAMLFSFHVDIPFDEVFASIAEVDMQKPWMLGPLEHLLTLGVERHKATWRYPLSVVCLDKIEPYDDKSGVALLETKIDRLPGLSYYQGKVVPVGMNVLAVRPIQIVPSRQFGIERMVKQRSPS